MSINIAPQYTQRGYRWTQWKAIKVTKGLVHQHDEDGDMYTVWGYDGPEAHICTIWKGALPESVIASGYTQQQNNADKAEFESDYLSTSNATIALQVFTQFEKRDKTLKLASAQQSIGLDSMAVILIKIPGVPGSGDGRWLNSGLAWFDAIHKDDRILSVRFTDEDNILGAGVGTVVGSYTDDELGTSQQGWRIPPLRGWINAEAIGGYGFAPAGFYIKIVGKKGGGIIVGTFYVNLEWGRFDPA